MKYKLFDFFIKLYDDVIIKPVRQVAIRLEPLEHRRMLCIAIRGKLSRDVDQFIRGHRNRSYSITNKCWYFPYTSEQLFYLFEELRKITPVEIHGEFPGVQRESKVVSRHTSGKFPAGYVEKLTLQRKSLATVKTYTVQFQKFLNYIHPKDPDSVTHDDICDYLLHLVNVELGNMQKRRQNIERS